jgi:RNA polymerase sigma factor (sigma-70 family)
VATAPVFPSPDWKDLVSRIQAGDAAALEELYAIFSKGVKHFFYRHLGSQDIEDRVHDTFLIVVQAIKKGEIREPERLMGFVRTIVRRHAAGQIGEIVQDRRDTVAIDQTTVIADRTKTPEEKLLADQKQDVALSVLRELAPKDREVLARFYLDEQSQEQICREMGLTDTQFRLLKSRAKAKFGELGKKKMHGSFLRKFSVRLFAFLLHFG